MKIKLTFHFGYEENEGCRQLTICACTPCPWHERKYLSDKFPSSHGFESHQRQQFHEKDNQHYWENRVGLTTSTHLGRFPAIGGGGLGNDKKKKTWLFFFLVLLLCLCCSKTNGRAQVNAPVTFYKSLKMKKNEEDINKLFGLRWCSVIGQATLFWSISFRGIRGL